MLPKSEKSSKFMSVLDLSKQSSSNKYSYEDSKYDTGANTQSYFPYQTSDTFGFNYSTSENKPRVLDLSLSSKTDSPFSSAFNSDASSISSKNSPLNSPSIPATEIYPSYFKNDNIFKLDNVKTNDYYERRRKNNISAKKSRDMKKKREEEQREKLLILEEENRKLKQKLAYCVCHNLRYYDPCGRMPLTVNYHN